MWSTRNLRAVGAALVYLRALAASHGGAPACLVFAMLSMTVGAPLASAGDPSAPPQSVDATADQALVLVRAQPSADLKALAERDDPDPWLVADALLARGERDAAKAWAGAAPRKATERLSAYAAVWSPSAADAACRAAVARVNAARGEVPVTEALAVVDAIEAPPDDVSGVRVRHARALALRRLKRYEECWTAYDEAAGLAERIGWTGRARTLWSEAALLSVRQRNFSGALARWERQRALEEAMGDRRAMAGTIANLGAVHSDAGQTAHALRLLAQALGMMEETGDIAGQAWVLQTIGVAQERARAFGDAVATYQRSIDLWGRAGKRDMVAVTLNALGLALSGLRRFDESLAAHERALRIGEELRDDEIVARSRSDIGEVRLDLHDIAGAIVDLEAARAINEALGDRAAVGINITNLAVAFERQRDYAQAVALQEEALQINEAVGSRPHAAVNLRNLASLQQDLGDFAAAEAYGKRSLLLFESEKDDGQIAGTLMTLGSIALDRGDAKAALALQARAMALLEKVDDPLAAARVLGNVALARQAFGDLDESLAMHRRALETFRAMGSRVDAARVHINVGVVYRMRGDYSQASASFAEARKLAAALGDSDLESAALHGQGTVQFSRGLYAEAISTFESTLQIDQAHGRRRGVAKALVNLGSVHEAQGEHAKALARMEDARRILEEVGARDDVATLLAARGNVYFAIGDYPAAQTLHEEALAMRKAMGDRPAIAQSLGDIGLDQEALGDFAAALSTYGEQANMANALKNRAGRAMALGAMGRLYAQLDQPDRALELLERALLLHEDLGRRGKAARARLDIADTHFRAGRVPQALALTEAALAEADALGDIDTQVVCLDRLGRCLVALERPVEALARSREAVERLSRVLGGLSEEQGARIRQTLAAVYYTGLDAARRAADVTSAAFFLESGRAGALLESLKGREGIRSTSIEPGLVALESLSRLRENDAAAQYRRTITGGAPDAVARAGAELEAARAGVREVVERIQREAKAAASVFYPRADPLPRIQARLREGEALVVYGTPPESGDVAVALVIEAKGARLVSLGAVSDLDTFVAAMTLDADAGDPTASIDALQRIVVQPLGLDAKVQRVLVSPDGSLSYVPFATLLPGREVVYVPSGTTYGFLLDQDSGRGTQVLALGDPAYPPKPDEKTLALLRGGAGLDRLPATREEAEAIGDVVLVGRDASEAGLEAAISKAPRWRAVHLACHGLVDARRPTLSSLALAPDDTHDGYLTELEVFRARIPADLVVLSACETGRGKVYRAEGIVGLTRAFMFAGAPRVLVSLWKVDDAATKVRLPRFRGGSGAGGDRGQGSGLFELCG